MMMTGRKRPTEAAGATIPQVDGPVYLPPVQGL